MTSPSSSIVVVDKSGSVDASNLIQASQHVHQAQHQPIRAQQVILNEEYLSGDNIVRTSNVNYLIPMPSTTPILKPSTISQHPNSKVHVISNVTLVSKADQPQPQTINFVNSKQLQQSAASISSRAPIAGGNYVNISTKSQLQTKMFKSPTITQIDPQTHIVSAQSQQQHQQQHIITKHLNNAGAIVHPKIPRNILVSTGRIQNKIEPTSITRTTPISQHQANQVGNVIQIQKPNSIAINKTNTLNVKSTKANQQAIKLVNQTISGVGGTGNTTIKHGNTSGVKSVTGTITNVNAIQQRNQNKTPYVQNSKTSQQQKPQHPSIHSNIPTNNRNNNNNNNTTINANTKLVQHSTQRTIMPMNNMCVQPTVIGQKVGTSKNTSASKYLAQTNPSISNIGQTSCISTTQYRSAETLQGDQRITTYRTIQPTESRPSSLPKSVTVVTHPSSVNSEKLNQSSARKETEWNHVRHRNGMDIGYRGDYPNTSDVGAKSSTAPSSVDDVIMVNGTHMSEEMSARILQSLSQKVVFHSSNSTNSNTTLATPNRPHRSAQPSSHRMIQPAPYKATQQSRSYVEYANKSGPEYFRVNTSDIQSTTSTFVDNIPLVSARGDENYSNANDLDDDIIGEEVRPKPIDSSLDMRIQALHALLQDHTYVQWPIDKQAQITASASIFNSNSPITSSTPSKTLEPPSSSSLSSPSIKAKGSKSQDLNGAIVSSNVSAPNHLTSPITQGNKNQHPSIASLIPGYSFGYNTMSSKDDDANSLISNESRNKSDIDQGEETETAPEAGNEDDSVTRCICELTHDDGYMICCDKCSVWQHVDCMGIDRQNIPEEYKCELCQPREIDQNRARTLQLMKRKEQHNLFVMKHSNPMSAFPIDSNTTQVPNSTVGSQLNAFSTIVANKKKGTLTAKSRKVDLFGANSKRKRIDANRSSNKRRDSKKSQSKRKSNSSTNSSATTPVKPSTTLNDSEKQSTSLRLWIENYEAAMTNHYSPELRARLHSLTKQMPSSTSNTMLSMLKNAGSLENKCTTVPHAGAKILISTREIAPSNPVIEIRGKYMLSSQFKAQQQANTSLSPNGNRHLSKMQPGPFLFFYRLPNDGPEICVDTRTYGNEARFVRRSCRPNAEIVYSIEKGTPHLYIVSLNTIRASTEITIKHEPHDLEALNRSEISAPTSTICGCGLIKDCMFGVASSTPTTPSGTPTSSKKSSKKPNGHVKDKSTSVFSPHRKKSKLDKVTRSNSETSEITSSSSINQTGASTNNTEGGKATDSILVKQQSTLEKTHQNQNTEKVNDKPVRKNNISVDSVRPLEAKEEPSPSPPVVKTSSSDSMKLNDLVDADETSSVKAQIDVKAEISQSHPIKSPPSTPISVAHMKSPSSKSGSSKKPTRKSTCSLSEDTGDEYSHGASNAKSERESKKGVENKKLTREERKMEAIVRAFEKMEKTEQRKNEQNKHKAGSNVPNSNSSSSLTKKRSASSFGKVIGDSDKLSMKKSSQANKRKRKRGKSYSQSSGQKRRRNRFDSHNSDDGNTSDESGTPMTSPTRLHDLNRHQRTPKEHRDKVNSDNMAAGLLLSLSTYGLTKNLDKNISSPDRFSSISKSQSDTPSYAVSSACLLIEAAVGPLDNDFKLPTKTKTKKTIMNEWLHQSDGSSSYPPQNQEHRLLSPSASGDYSHSDSNINCYSHEEPRNLSIAAQKIEEFIHLTSGEQIDDDECSKWSGSPICTSSDTMTVTTPLPTPPLQMGSSVKKRWLRQAISEECSDELLASSATSSPPNGFMAPLKKRRAVRECSDLNAEDMPSPKEDTKDLALEDEISESNVKEDNEKLLNVEDIKTETDLELKESNNDTTLEPRSEVTEHQSVMDVDKFEPIESDEDEEMCTQIEIKADVDESHDKSAGESDPNNKYAKSQNDIEASTVFSDTKLFGENHLNMDEAQLKQMDEVAIPPLPNMLPKTEIEDIQQKLHSFHSENLMILQSRNKKRASRATTPTSLDETTTGTAALKDAPSSNEIKPKIRKFSSENHDYKCETSNKLQMEDAVLPNQYHQSGTAVAQNANVVNQSIANTHPFSSYGVNQYESNIPSTQLYSPAALSSFANVNSQSIPSISTSNALYHYLESPNRTPVYNATTYNASHMFSMHTNVPLPTLLNSSNYLTKNYSTLSEPSTPVANVTTPPILTQSATTVNPKVLSRTQSADPRLNPPKDVPPTTPKRKLSINEYRKRKQLTTTSEKPQPESTTEKAESLEDSPKPIIVEEKPKNGLAVADTTKETVFSPAPTLLEMQQENLSRRLKSYKSLHELSSSSIDLIKPTDVSLETEISTSISDVLNASSSNSSLTSISSPTSQDFNDAEINDPVPAMPEEVNAEDLASGQAANPGDLQKEKSDSDENDFDLEPADPLRRDDDEGPTQHDDD